MRQSLFKSVKDGFSSVGQFVVSFFSSWYGRPVALGIMLVSSAFLVTCFTKSFPVLESLLIKQHTMTFLFNIVLMVPVVLVVGMTVYSLDKSAYWSRYKTGRWIFQLLMLCPVLGAVILRTVRWVYLGLFDEDLFEIGYIERDFVLVMMCILLQQVYYLVYGMWREIEDLHKSVLMYEEKEQRLIEEGAAIRGELEAQRAGCGDCAMYLIYAWSILSDMYKEIEVSFDETAFVHIPVRFLSKVYIQKKDGVKLFYAKLLNEREVLLNINSLSGLEALCPSILVKNKTDELINILSIRTVEIKEDRAYLDLFGGEIVEVGKVYWERLRIYLDELERAMDKAKELLKRNWDVQGEEE
ncbi:hypothetical protein [Sphingobacterium paucimobilis]|uniref:Uncharacterized protein n=1 Tax=Sphingobacterium paucimobilis HER1398 TaxID=1346330 RepID=U2H6W3_9SPHI|nr:hypothetical protein [Sphingobacterium paucimobilis]ERJ57446.1 hypothetical protein M472_01570 [Sphingobacterium paucimobilis HER1398]